MDLLQWQILTQRLDAIDAAIASGVATLLARIDRLGGEMALDFTQLQQADADLKAEIAAAIATMNADFQALQDALTNQPADQAAIDALTASVQGHLSDLQAAVTADTITPPPTPVR